MDHINESIPNGFIENKFKLIAKWQSFVDKATPYTTYRWLSFGVLFGFFLLRIIIVQGWYIICYALSIYLLNMFLAFLTPKFNPSIQEEEEENEQGSVLPIRNDQEFRPFIRRLPEFKFWYSSIKATVISFICSFIPFFDIPVFWPILFIYFCLLFTLTMKKQIQHMIRYKYVPFDLGKKKYIKTTTVDMDVIAGKPFSSSST